MFPLKNLARIELSSRQHSPIFEYNVTYERAQTHK